MWHSFKRVLQKEVMLQILGQFIFEHINFHLENSKDFDDCADSVLKKRFIWLRHSKCIFIILFSL